MLLLSPLQPLLPQIFLMIRLHRRARLVWVMYGLLRLLWLLLGSINPLLSFLNSHFTSIIILVLEYYNSGIFHISYFILLLLLRLLFSLPSVMIYYTLLFILLWTVSTSAKAALFKLVDGTMEPSCMDFFIKILFKFGFVGIVFNIEV